MKKTDTNPICRSCLEPSDEMYPLMEIILNVDVNIAAMLSYCTTKELELNEDLPDSVCIPCFKTIRVAYNFLLHFRESQRKLLEQINKTRDKLKEIQVDDRSVCANADNEEEFHSHNANNISYGVEENTNSNDNSPVNATYTNYISYDLAAIHNYASKSKPEEVVAVPLEEDENNLNPCVQGDVNRISPGGYYPSLIEYEKVLNVKDNLLSSSDAAGEHMMSTADSVEEKTVSNPVHMNKQMPKDKASQVKKYVCPMCKIIFQQFAKFHNHVLLHDSDTIMCSKCPQVNQVKLNSLEYIEHYKEVHRYQCDICDRCFRPSYGYRYHMKHHEDIRQYACPIESCTKSYFLLHLLRKHMLTHSETAACNLCGATFRIYDSYRYHRKTHDGTRNYLCTICGKAFFQTVHLRDHVFRHKGYKPFTCDMCGNSFTTNSQLKEHLRYCRQLKQKRN